MRIRALLVFFTVLTQPGLAAGEPTAVIPTITQEQLRLFARDRIDDGYAILLGPIRPSPAPVAVGDCGELYARRVALMRAQLDYRKPFWDEPRHSSAVLIGAIWAPAFYYLPFRAITDFSTDERRAGTTAELDALRAVSASQRCFES